MGSVGMGQHKLLKRMEVEQIVDLPGAEHANMSRMVVGSAIGAVADGCGRGRHGGDY